MDLEGIMLSEISQTEKYCVISFICGIWKISKLVNITKKKQTHRYRGYQWGEGRGERKDRGRGLRGTNYYV